MKKIFLLMLFISGLSFANKQFYFEQPAELTGKLSEVKSHHPNPEYGEKPQPAIFLTQPIDVLVSKDDSFSEVELNVTKVQLAYGADIEKKLKALKNKQVSISCSDLFHGHTAHHTTDVLCSVKDIKPLK